MRDGSIFLQTKKYASCNFITWGYPSEYMNELEHGLPQPDLAYHQGYIIRRLTGFKDLPNKLFEINLPLSKGFQGAPLLLKNKNKDNNWNLVGIYIGTREYLIDERCREIVELINEIDFSLASEK